ncbi:MAG TPA: FecR domain-containing protein [Usitatibacteraceae bacterium]|nr:FecR domain-containing protein [Usitatibacteraceae bacterium]
MMTQPDALANPVGQIKVVRGQVQLQRAGQLQPAMVGMPVQGGDIVITGSDGAAGITFIDNSLISTGPGSAFVIDEYQFDPTTHAGKFKATLRRGTLAGVSGKMVKHEPESMRIATPSAIMGVRGTEFAIRVDDNP